MPDQAATRSIPPPIAPPPRERPETGRSAPAGSGPAAANRVARVQFPKHNRLLTPACHPFYWPSAPRHRSFAASEMRRVKSGTSQELGTIEVIAKRLE